MRYAAVLVMAMSACTSNDPAEKTAIDASVDAGVDEDAVSPDAEAPPSDGAVDDETTASSGWCASNGLHFFCDDFDEDALAHDWDANLAQHGALTLDRTTATSPPYALLASTTPLGTGDVARIALEKSIVDPAPHLHFAFDFAVDSLPAGAGAVVFALQLLDPDGVLIEDLSLRVSGAGGSLEDAAPGTLDGGADFSASHPFAWPELATAGRWSRVALDLDLGDDGGVGHGVVSVSVGAKVALDRVQMSPESQAGQPEIELGIVSASGPSPAVAVRFDDFTFDTIP